MKRFALIFVLILATTEAWAESQEDNHSSTPAPFTLEGDWTMIRHACSSGAPPADAYVPGRDRLEISFNQQTFSSRSRVGACDTWTTGRYTFDGNVLVMNSTQVNSNCDARGALGRFSYPLDFMGGDNFVIHMGPVDGGVCPRGDLLQNTYRRTN